MLDMQEAVEDAILTGGTKDKVLAKLILIADASVSEHRPVFGVLDEPVLFRKFRKWTSEAIELRKTMDSQHKKAIEDALD